MSRYLVSWVDLDLFQVTIEKTPRYFVIRRAPKRIALMDEERRKNCTNDERTDPFNFPCRPIKVISFREMPSSEMSQFLEIKMNQNHK